MPNRRREAHNEEGKRSGTSPTRSGDGENSMYSEFGSWEEAMSNVQPPRNGSIELRRTMTVVSS